MSMSVDLPRPANRAASPVDPEVVSLVTGIIGNIETLVAQQMRLAQREVAAGLKSRSTAGAVVVSGLAVGMLAASAMSAAAAHGLHGWLSPGVTDPAAWPLGACFALVGAVLGLLGAGLVGVGLWKFRAIAPWSGLAENLIQESTSWTKAPQ
jgi:hypothetical protein